MKRSSTERQDQMPTEKPPDDAEQSARFLATAKELDAEKEGRAFMRAFGVVVSQPVLTGAPETPKIKLPKAGRKKAAGAISDG